MSGPSTYEFLLVSLVSGADTTSMTFRSPGRESLPVVHVRGVKDLRDASKRLCCSLEGYSRWQKEEFSTNLGHSRPSKLQFPVKPVSWGHLAQSVERHLYQYTSSQPHPSRRPAPLSLATHA